MQLTDTTINIEEVKKGGYHDGKRVNEEKAFCKI